MNDIRLSLTPLQDRRWVVHQPTGTEYLISAMPADEDQELGNRASNFSGAIDHQVFARSVAERHLHDWRYVGGPDGALPCNPENVRLFVKHHGLVIMPFIIRECRSLDNYRQKEIEAAKNA